MSAGKCRSGESESTVYTGSVSDLVRWVLEKLNCRLEIVKRSDQAPGFEVILKRWTVEITFAWLENSKGFQKILNIWLIPQKIS